MENLNLKILKEDEINNIFLQSCENGDVKTIDYLIKNTHLKENSKRPISAFLIACKSGQLEVVKYFTKMFPLMRFGSEDKNAVYWACKNNHIDILEHLFSNEHLQKPLSLTNAFISSCQSGSIETTKYLLLDKKVNIHYNNDQCLDAACESNNVELLKYLLTSPQLIEEKISFLRRDEVIKKACLKKNFEISTYLINLSENPSKVMTSILLNACEENEIEVVKYLLTNKDLKENADIHVKDDKALITACEYNNIEIVKYLLTSPELKEHADIHAQKDRSLSISYFNSGEDDDAYYELIRYLLTSSDLTDHSNPYVNDEIFIIHVCENEDDEMLEILILEYGLAKTEIISSYIKGNPRIQELFNKKELSNRLNENLKEKDDDLKYRKKI